jgi:hypothetical protein
VNGVNDLASRSPGRQRRMALTEHERQILIAELAQITMELDALQERTAEVTARVTRRPPIRLAQSA